MHSAGFFWQSLYSLAVYLHCGHTYTNLVAVVVMVMGVAFAAWPVELLSDMLRVLVLWWWGGVYSDTDVISLRRLTLPPNSLGFENSGQIGSAFYSFHAQHPTLLKLMEDMQYNFKVCCVVYSFCLYLKA